MASLISDLTSWKLLVFLAQQPYTTAIRGLVCVESCVPDTDIHLHNRFCLYNCIGPSPHDSFPMISMQA